MRSTFNESRSMLKRLLMRIGLWQLLDWIGVRKLLVRWGRSLIPRLRREDRLLEGDFQRFGQEHGSYLATPAYPVAGRKLLVASLSDWLAQVKLESILAKSLQFTGYHPVIASFSYQERAHRYHRLFGLDDFAYADRLIGRGDRRTAKTETNRFLQRRPGFRDVLAFEFRGVPVGRHVLSSIVSYLRSGTVAFEDPQVMNMLGSGLAEAMTLVFAAERLFDRVQPDLILILERGYVPYAAFFDVGINRGIPAIQYCSSHRSDAYILKRYHQGIRTQHPWSLSKQSWEQVRRMPWSTDLADDLMSELRGRYEQGQWFNRKFLQIGKKIKTPEEVRSQLGLDPRKKTAVIFSHVLWDATFFYGTTLFDDYEHWLVETVKAACANPAVNWVVKLHPDYVWKMKRAGDTRQPPEFAALGGRVGRLPDHVKLLEPQTDISTYSLFAVTDWCLTVRGTIGIEMPCFGIPVLTAGTGRYSGFGFTIDSGNREEYLDRLRHIQNIPPLTPEQVELARRHAYGLLRLRPFPFTTFTMVQDKLDELGNPLDHNIVLHTASLAELRDARDLRNFARWVGTDQTEDYLASLESERYLGREAA
jgi:hypothetical protein